MTVIWTGVCYDGETSRSRRVHVEPGPDGLRWRAEDGEAVTWPYAEVQVAQGQWPGQPVRLQRGREAIVVADARLLAAMAAAAPGARLPRAISQRSLVGRALAAVGGAALISALFFQGINPAIASLLAPHVPVAWEEKLGQLVVDHYAPVAQRCQDPERMAQLGAVLARLTAAQASPYTYKLILLRSDEVNAFAAPGGYIVVYSALLQRTESAEELAGVLAHEVQHIQHRHVTRHMLQGIGVQAVASVLMGDTGMSTLAWFLSMLRYGQAMETEADAEGMRLMLAARLDPQAMVRTFRVHLASEAESEPGAWAWLSTHPRLGDRVRRLEAMAAQAHDAPRPIALEAPWARLNLPCEWDDEHNRYME